jgi:hypothetical protein
VGCSNPCSRIRIDRSSASPLGVALAVVALDQCLDTAPASIAQLRWLSESDQPPKAPSRFVLPIK